MPNSQASDVSTPHEKVPVMNTFKLSDTTAQLIISQEIEIYDILADRESRVQAGEQTLLQELYYGIAGDHCLHPDDDFEDIIDILYEEIAADYA